ncbi:RCC1 domain-containing protein [Paenibacillus sp. YYML68]|uniref:RCC1 domain-containing protein n=1 Tax=Paenibacillus sp. YYML68 TaxID=2909250 RepID=UPI0024939048|nr:RCC1 domain-containing protein [Paenibacillus sp. YYML68]
MKTTNVRSRHGKLVLLASLTTLLAVSLSLPSFAANPAQQANDEPKPDKSYRLSLTEYQCSAYNSKGEIWVWSPKGTEPAGVKPVRASAFKDAASYHYSRGDKLMLKQNGTVWRHDSSKIDFMTGWPSNPDYFSYGALQITGLKDITKISSTHFINMALDKDGNVWMWNYLYPELGQVNLKTSEPVKLPLERKAVDISAGHNYLHVIQEDGTVWVRHESYGASLHRELTQIKGLTDIVKLSQGDSDVFYAMKKDGTVWTWGENPRGTEGMPSLSNIKPVQYEGITDVETIHTNGRTTLALTKDGTVWTWGRTMYCTINDCPNMSPDESYPMQPRQVDELRNIMDISVQPAHNMAIDHHGVLWSWGSNVSDQLANGTTESTEVPVRAAHLPSIQ